MLESVKNSSLMLIGGVLGNYLSRYDEIARGFVQSSALKVARERLIHRNRLSDDLRYVLDFEDKLEYLGPKLPEERVKILLSLITHYTRLLNQNQSSAFLNNFRQGIERLFDLPYEFHLHIDDDTVQSLKKKVTKDYPQVHVLVNNFIDQLAQYLKYPNANPKPNPLLLLGPAGVGKTRLVEELITKELGLSFYRVSLANTRMAQLAGESNANLCNNYFEGVLFEALVHASRNNHGRAPVVVFFDDICSAFTKGAPKIEEQEVVTWLTEVLDPDRSYVLSKVYNRYVSSKNPQEGLKLKLSDFIFMAAANSNHFLLTPGMERRLQSKVTFPPMSVTQKKAIAIDYVKSLEQKSTQVVEAEKLLSDVLKKDALRKVTLTVADLTLVQALAQRDPFPGAGTMKDAINKWYASKKADTVFDYGDYYDKLMPIQKTPPLAFSGSDEEVAFCQVGDAIRRRDSLKTDLYMFALTNLFGKITFTDMPKKIDRYLSHLLLVKLYVADEDAKNGFVNISDELGIVSMKEVHSKAPNVSFKDPIELRDYCLFQLLVVQLPACSYRIKINFIRLGIQRGLIDINCCYGVPPDITDEALSDKYTLQLINDRIKQFFPKAMDELTGNVNIKRIPHPGGFREARIVNANALIIISERLRALQSWSQHSPNNFLESRILSMNLFALAYLEKAGDDLTQLVDLCSVYERGFTLCRDSLKRKYYHGSLMTLMVKGGIDDPLSKHNDGATFFGLIHELIEEKYGKANPEAVNLLRERLFTFQIQHFDRTCIGNMDIPYQEAYGAFISDSGEQRTTMTYVDGRLKVRIL